MATSVFKVQAPQPAWVTSRLSSIDYSDCFVGEFRTGNTVTIENLVRYFMNYNPRWVEWLVRFRNLLVRPFGLQTDAGSTPILAIQKGDKISVFEVVENTEDEVLLFYNDKHLDACFSIALCKLHQQYEVTIATTVHFHNNLGRVYFFFVKPFHIIIIKTMMIQMIKHFSNHS